jgi:hypothetical protein
VRCLFYLLLAGSSAALSAQIQEPPPSQLLDAGHCLAAASQDWLDVAGSRPYEVELGYVSAGKSGSADDSFYLIDYTTPTHTEGFAFVFQTGGKDPHRSLLLQYRTRFRQTDDGSQRVSLVDPPLGGIGTQDDILAAIKQIGFHTWTVPVAALKSHASPVHCETAEGIM